MESIFKEKAGRTLQEWIIENKEFYNGPGVNNKIVCEREYYEDFLRRTDYITNKIFELQLLGLDCKDYTSLLEARNFARNRIHEINIEVDVNWENYLKGQEEELG